MRTHLLLFALLPAACGPGPSQTSEAPAEPEASWARVAVAGALELQLRDRLAAHGTEPNAVLRLVNHGDRPLLVDLRSLERVVRPDAPSGLRLPLSEAQVSELSMISALAQVRPGEPVTYGVAVTPAACEGARTVELAGVLVALDEARTIELVADGATGSLSCASPTPAPSGTMWVTSSGALQAAGADPGAFATDAADTLIRGAAVDPAVEEVALLAFSYDARPIERWRYDACVALGQCPTRVVPQPPGSIRAPAVGMDRAGVAAFCAARSLRAPSAPEITAVGDPGRALIEVAEGSDVVAVGLRCARTEEDPTTSP